MRTISGSNDPAADPEAIALPLATAVSATVRLAAASAYRPVRPKRNPVLRMADLISRSRVLARQPSARQSYGGPQAPFSWAIALTSQ